MLENYGVILRIGSPGMVRKVFLFFHNNTTGTRVQPGKARRGSQRNDTIKHDGKMLENYGD
jgi:hypothetical protein